MNSEIYGKPTGNTHGFVFVNDFSHMLERRYDGTIDDVSYEKTNMPAFADNTGIPIRVNVLFERKIRDEQKVNAFGSYQLAEDLTRYNYDRNVFLPLADSVTYEIVHKDKRLLMSAIIGGTPRYPTQLYEAASYLFIFLLLLFIFYRLGPRLRNGFIFGLFLIMLFTARFLIEFVKENQEAFEDNLSINMGQILSVPFIIAGIALTLWKWPVGLHKE
jgi:prolipoprotein diacylglyceryltransferase